MAGTVFLCKSLTTHKASDFDLVDPSKGKLQSWNTREIRCGDIYLLPFARLVMLRHGIQGYKLCAVQLILVLLRIPVLLLLALLQQRRYLLLVNLDNLSSG